jgi:hypothetical protein
MYLKDMVRTLKQMKRHSKRPRQWRLRSVSATAKCKMMLIEHESKMLNVK